MLEMRPSKRLKLVKELLPNNALDAMNFLMTVDAPDVAVEVAKEADRCVAVLKMSVVDLGLDVEDLKTRLGSNVKLMVENARVSMLKEDETWDKLNVVGHLKSVSKKHVLEIYKKTSVEK